MSEQKKVTMYGERLKREAKKRGWKNRDMCDFLGYQNEKTISKIYSGRQKLPDRCFKALSQKWGLREEYLKCIDDFETDD
nr:hypothetical protein [Lachnospiraceae bacterium]